MLSFYDFRLLGEAVKNANNFLGLTTKETTLPSTENSTQVTYPIVVDLQNEIKVDIYTLYMFII